MRAFGFRGEWNRRPRRFTRALPQAALALVLLGPATLADASSPPPGDTLTVLFTAETRGNLAPCSCPQNPVGGLARRVGFLQAAAADRRSGGPTWIVDVGGFLPEGDAPVRNAPGVAARYVALLLRGFERGGYVASVLDHGQAEFLRRLAPEESARLGGVFHEADPPGPPTRLHWGARRVALLALEESLPDSTVIRCGVEARADADYLIVLGRADAISGRRLARLARADLVLLSRGARPAAPLREGNSILVGCGREGREVGEIRLVADESSGGGSTRLRATTFQLHLMDASAPEDPDLSRRTAELLRVAGPDAFVEARE